MAITSEKLEELLPEFEGVGFTREEIYSIYNKPNGPQKFEDLTSEKALDFLDCATTNRCGRDFKYFFSKLSDLYDTEDGQRKVASLINNESIQIIFLSDIDQLIEIFATKDGTEKVQYLLGECMAGSLLMDRHPKDLEDDLPKVFGIIKSDDGLEKLRLLTRDETDDFCRNAFIQPGILIDICNSKYGIEKVNSLISDTSFLESDPLITLLNKIRKEEVEEPNHILISEPELNPSHHLDELERAFSRRDQNLLNSLPRGQNLLRERFFQFHTEEGNFTGEDLILHFLTSMSSEAQQEFSERTKILVIKRAEELGQQFQQRDNEKENSYLAFAQSKAISMEDLEKCLAMPGGRGMLDSLMRLDTRGEVVTRENFDTEVKRQIERELRKNMPWKERVEAYNRGRKSGLSHI